MREESTVLRILAGSIRKLFLKCQLDYEKLEEIRLRIGQPVWILYQQKPYYLMKNGTLGQDSKEAYRVSQLDLKETMEYASGHSMYAYENERRQGYLTIQGGHRIGLAGKVVVENGRVKMVSDIGMINIRLAHEQIGCAKKILRYIKEKDEVLNTLLISPPGGGKTTLLRDLIRLLASKEEGMTVGVVDERSEIAASYMGVPQNNLGITVDVLDSCPKAEGMMMLLRSMAPDVIAVDEIGTMEDQRAIFQVMNSGCRILATMHGASVQEVFEKKMMQELLQQKVFRRFVVLDNRYHVGAIKEIYKEDGSNSCGDFARLLG